MMSNCAILLRREPPDAVAVFGADRRRPRQLVVDLDEVVVPQHGRFGLDASEERHHALFELRFEPWDVAGRVDV